MNNTEKIVKIYDKNKKLIGRGHLLSISSGMIKIKGYNLPVLPSKTEIFVEVYNEFQGISPCLCQVSIASGNQMNALINKIDPIIERRKSLKVRSDLSFYIEKLERKEEDIAEAVPNIKINLINLSIGGMLISSSYDLKINDIITFYFKYSNFQDILLIAKVIRIDKVYDHITNVFSAYNYGCVFKRLVSSEESVITKYLFDRQLHLYRR